MNETHHIEVKTVYVVTCPLCGLKGSHPHCQQKAIEYLREHDEGWLGSELRKAAELQATMRRWDEEMRAEMAALCERFDITADTLNRYWGSLRDANGYGLSWNTFYKGMVDGALPPPQ